MQVLHKEAESHSTNLSVGMLRTDDCNNNVLPCKYLAHRQHLCCYAHMFDVATMLTSQCIKGQVQASTAQEPLKGTVEDEAGPGPEADLIGTEVAGVQEGYSSTESGDMGAVAVTGQEPRLVLLWEWQCPLPPSATLSTRVTCMAWNKVRTTWTKPF